MRTIRLHSIIFLVFFNALTISLSCSSQTIFTPVSYRLVEFSLPKGWSFKTQEIRKDFAYQILCWEEGSANTFIIQWFENELRLEEYLDLMKRTLKNDPVYENVIFKKNEEGVFQNKKSKYSKLSNSFGDLKLEGNIIAFHNDYKTFLLFYQGVSDCYRGKTFDNIISSINLNVRNELNKQPEGEKFILYEIEDIGQITVPRTLELRNDNSAIESVVGGLYDMYYIHKKIQLIKSQLVFQPKGSDKLDRVALSRYGRIMIDIERGEHGDFLKCDEEFDLNEEERQDLEDYLKKQILSSMKNTFYTSKLVRWDGLTFGKINEFPYMRISFVRQLEGNPEVKVDNYTFFNSNVAVEITFSYRISEASIWEGDFQKVLNSFNFNRKCN